MKWVKGAGGVAQVVGPCGARGEGERARGDRSTGVVAVTADRVDDRPPGLDCRTEGPAVRGTVRVDRRQPAGGAVAHTQRRRPRRRRARHRPDRRRPERRRGRRTSAASSLCSSCRPRRTPGAEVAAFLEGPTSIQRQPWAVDDQQIANPRGRGRGSRPQAGAQPITSIGVFEGVPWGGEMTPPADRSALDLLDAHLEALWDGTDPPPPPGPARPAASEGGELARWALAQLQSLPREPTTPSSVRSAAC